MRMCVQTCTCIYLYIYMYLHLYCLLTLFTAFLYPLSPSLCEQNQRQITIWQMGHILYILATKNLWISSVTVHATATVPSIGRRGKLLQTKVPWQPSRSKKKCSHTPPSELYLYPLYKIHIYPTLGIKGIKRKYKLMHSLSKSLWHIWTPFTKDLLRAVSEFRCIFFPCCFFFYCPFQATCRCARGDVSK